MLSIKDLESNIKEYAQSYYLGNPVITDAEFDRLINTLRELDPINSLLHTVGWGHDINLTPLVKVKHTYGLVGSLNKIHSLAEKAFTGYYLAMAKLDGSTCTAYYKEGQLQYALSRGDGITGSDITNKYLFITKRCNIKVPTNFTGAVRGEMVISNTNWAKYKETNPEAKLARNVGTGWIMGDDIKEDMKYLDFVTYKIHGSTGLPKMSILETIQCLNAWNFQTVSYKLINFSLKVTDEDMKKLYDEFCSEYPCDGVVLTCNTDIDVGKDGHYNYEEIAYKFASETAETKVIGIDWKLSRMNKLVPTVLLEPVLLDGASIGRASGFNAKYIKENQIGAGAVIEIMRSGQVIPDIQKVLEPSNQMDIPENCPICGEPLYWTETGVDLKCCNENCMYKSYSDLYRWIEINGEVEGIGPALIEQMINTSKASNIVEFYNWLRKPCCITDLNTVVGGVAATKCILSTKKLLGSITAVKGLVGMNLPLIGERISKELIERDLWKYIEQLAELTEYAVDEVNTYIGNYRPGVAASLIENAPKVAAVLSVVNFIDTEPKAKEVSMKYVAVTGSLSVSRKEFETYLADNGYEITDNIKNAECLITNDPSSGSSKNEKARKLSKPVITEQEFRNNLQK